MAEKIHHSTLCEVKNVGTAPVKVGYDNMVWVIKPQQTSTIPYFAACLMFGDPRSVDTDVNDPDKRHRTMEAARLDILYGTYSAPWYKDEPYTWKNPIDARPELEREYVPLADGRFIHPNLPRVEVHFSDGERIVTVIEDPAGDGLTDAKRTAQSESKVQGDQIAELQRQLAQLQYQQSMTSQKIQANPDFEGDLGAATEAPAVTPSPRPVIDDDGGIAASGTSSTSRRGPGRPRKDS